MRRLKHLKLDSKIHFEEEFRNEAQKVVSHRVFANLARRFAVRRLTSAFSFVILPAQSDAFVFKENFTRSVKEKMKGINPDNNDKPFYWRAVK
jgi:hypothetical protein